MGGKSRKTGGISKSLIDRIKSGQKIGVVPERKADSKKAKAAPRRTGGFDLDE